MDKKSIKGFLAGIAFSILVVIFLNQVVDMQSLLSPESQVGTVTAKELSDIKVDEKISKKELKKKIDIKISTIDRLVDKYYLNEVNRNDMLNNLCKGYISGLNDPYSRYYTSEEFTSMMESSDGVYCGIGINVAQDPETGVIYFGDAFKGGPAAKAGLRKGDILYKVDGKEISGQDISTVISKTKGKEGTKVKIEVIRNDIENPLKFNIEREKIESPTVTHKMLKDKIGYISIEEFDKVTYKQFKEALKDLESKNQKSLIIDVRNNPGGNLDTVVKMLDLMISSGTIVYQEDKNGKRFDEEKATAEEEFTKPCVVMINGRSASAAEIFAGALQDHKKATILGETSFGKGIVQTVIPFKDGTAIKLTTSKYFTPKGRNIHGIGITPDVSVKLNKESKDNQLQKAIKILKK